MALMKLCRCGKRISQSEKYCSDCTKEYEKERADSNKAYDKNIRCKKSASFYNSTEWIATREYILAKYKGLDIYELFIRGNISYAEPVHHIVEIKEDWSRRLDTTNLIPLTDRNHNKIHSMYIKDKEGTQKMLFNLLKRWEKEYKG